MSKSSAKQGPPAVGKKYKVKKVIEKPKPAQKSAAKKVVKAEKKANPGGISGKYTGLKEKKPKAAAAVKTDGPVSTIHVVLCISQPLIPSFF